MGRKSALLFEGQGIKIVYTNLSRKLEMSLTGVGFSVEPGESIVPKKAFPPQIRLLNFKRASLHMTRIYRTLRGRRRKDGRGEPKRKDR